MTTTVRGPYDRPTSEIFYNTFRAANPGGLQHGADFPVGDSRNDDPSTRYSLNTMATVTGVESRAQRSVRDALGP
jgi:hypothetical protein